MKKYIDKIFNSLVDWIFRKKSLNYILGVVIFFTLRELTAIGRGEDIIEFFNTVQEKNEDGWIFWSCAIGKMIFGGGSYFVVGVVLLLIFAIFILKKTELIQANSGEKFDSIIKNLKEKNQNQKVELQDLELSQEELEFKKNELKKFLDKVNNTLQSKNISKEELIKRVTGKLKALLIYKSYELPPKTIRDEVYPALGVQNVSSGLSIIPPQKLNQKLSEEKLIEWFKSEINKRVPIDYEYNISLIAVVDLTKMSVYKKLEPYRRFNRTYLDKIRIEDLLTLREIESFLYKEEKLSSKEIIQIPNITFLIEDYNISKEEMESLFKYNDNILTEIKNTLGVATLVTTDFAVISPETIISSIDDYVAEPQNVAEIIIRNATFWKDYFERKIN
ncbi:MAG: hypothetical protein EVB11_12390 [Winogradskyella sp.]|nr:MAG: hypothetical protein EVB11_12390 [Winogradskyella sp.]